MVLKKNAPAKLNLGLHVLRKRDDGFHDIETVFVRMPWADVLTAIPSEVFAFTTSDPGLPTDERNLCVRAARLLQREAGVREGVVLHLEKHLPFGAGLGGGSSDAATTLRLLVELWGLRISVERIRALAEEIGSDVSFFLGPEAAYGTGRGERLAPLVDPSTDEPYRIPYPVVVLVPPVEVPTGAAYMMVTPDGAGRPDLREVVLSNDLARWRDELVNDFQAPILAAYPAIAAARQELLDAGAAYASLSGSGAAVFGVFEKEAEAEAAAEAGRLSGNRVFRF